MTNPPPDSFGNASFDTAARAFMAGAVPAVLAPLAERIRSVHPAICRLGMLLSDEAGMQLQRWVDSDGRVMPVPAALSSVEANPGLDRCRSATERHATGLDMDPAIEWANGSDARTLIAFPVASHNTFSGFLVADARPGARITGAAMRSLAHIGPFAADIVAGGLESMDTLVGTVRFTRDFTLMRDRETGEHQIRLGAYLHIMATEMSRAHGLPEGFADELTVFGQLHDIGKVGVVDDILLKPGRFERFEWEQMKEHVNLGRELVCQMRENLCPAGAPGLETLQAVVAFHHEYLDGSGYPDGRMGDEIPMVARIVTVADIFDALTCERRYKRPWPVAEAFDYLNGLAGDKLDADCVAAMNSARARITSACLARGCGKTARPH